MKNLELIAAIGVNNELGAGNELIWRIKEDMRAFKKITWGKTMVMGRKTYESMPKNLEGRRYLVLTKSNIIYPNAGTITDKDRFLRNIENTDEEYIVVGGAQIYNLFINDVDIMYLTRIDSEYKLADAYFPRFNEDDFNKTLLMEGIEPVPYKQYKYVRR